MSTHEPIADREGRPAPTGAGVPSRSAVVSAPAVRGVRAVRVVSAAEDEVDGAQAAAEPPADGKANAEAEDEARSGAGESGGGWRPRDLLLLAGVCVLALLLVNAFVARPFAVPSESMENTLYPGDRLIANKLAYAFGSHVQRGDVVVFDGTGSFLPSSAAAKGFGASVRGFAEDLGLAPDSDTVYVKRVIGVGGDRVTCTGPGARITVNGVPLDESDYLAPGDQPSSVGFDVVVPTGKLWVMGDHRSASRDSRDHLGEPGGGFVPEGRVIGRADWVVYPFGHWSSLDRPAGFAAPGGTGGHGEQG